MDRIAVVTGADRGLGLALTAGLLEKEWRVFAGQYMVDWSELPDLSEKCPNTLTIIPLDVSSTPSAHDAAQLVSQDTDRVDLLVNKWMRCIGCITLML